MKSGEDQEEAPGGGLARGLGLRQICTPDEISEERITSKGGPTHLMDRGADSRPVHLAAQVQDLLRVAQAQLRGGQYKPVVEVDPQADTSGPGMKAQFSGDLREKPRWGRDSALVSTRLKPWAPQKFSRKTPGTKERPPLP